MTDPRHAKMGGQSLVELMVVVLVLGVIMTAIVSSFISTQDTADRVDNRLENIGEAQKLIEATSKDIRTATPLKAGESPFVTTVPNHASARELVFYANLNPDTTVNQSLPNKVRIYIDSSNPASPVLKEVVWEPTNKADLAATVPIYPTAHTNLRLVGQYVANAANDPIFRFFDIDGDELIPLTTTGLLSATDQIAVRKVRISLSVRKATGRKVKPTRVETTVRLANVVYGNLTATE